MIRQISQEAFDGAAELFEQIAIARDYLAKAPDLKTKLFWRNTLKRLTSLRRKLLEV